MPELSIVLPTCNRATLLADAIAHVRRNTRTDYELIVVDGTSNTTWGRACASSANRNAAASRRQSTSASAPRAAAT
jgi:hypothetical protein